MFSAYS
jgi:hypothetical protein